VHAIALGALAFSALTLHLARQAPRILPAFDQRFFPVLLSSLAIAFPVSAWQCRERARDFRWVLAAYGAAFGVLTTESLCALAVFRAPRPQALLLLACVGLVYGLLQLCIAKLAEKRLYAASLALLLFAATGIVDLYRANHHHGRIHWVLSWTV